MLDGRIYLFNGYYQSNVFYSDDWGQTWTFWFESLIAHYYQMYRCGETFYLHGLAGDGFHPYMFEVPNSLLSQTNVPSFWSGCHNINPSCYYPPNSNIPEVVAYFDNVFENLCTLAVSDADKTSATLFPNPVRDVFEINIENPVLQITVYNPLGQPLANFSNTTRCHVEGLPSGIYLAAIQTDKTVSTVRFIKE